MTQEARCVIIGGGAMGVGLLYYLAHEGWTDTILLEKGELTSGSTWHAAGLIPNFIGDLNMAKVHEEAVALYPRLEEETGLSAGWHGCGAIRLARTDDEVDWHRYVHAMLTQVGIESYLIGPTEIRERHPLLEDLSDIQLGFYTPNDGWTDPSGCTNAMARGARNLGCEIRRHTLVTDMSQLPDGRWEIIATPGGMSGKGAGDSYRIVCEHVVNAAGHYAPQLGAMVGLEVPIVSVIHQYLVTEPLQAMIDLGYEPPGDPRPPVLVLLPPGDRRPAGRPLRDVRLQGVRGGGHRLGPRLPPHRRERRRARGMPGVHRHAHPRLRRGRHQADRVRPDHPHPRFRVPDGTRAGAAQLLALQRRLHRHHPGARARGSTWPSG